MLLWCWFCCIDWKLLAEISSCMCLCCIQNTSSVYFFASYFGCERDFEMCILYLYVWMGCDVVCRAIKFGNVIVHDVLQLLICTEINRIQHSFSYISFFWFLCQIVEIDWTLTYYAYFIVCKPAKWTRWDEQHIVIFVIKSQMISCRPLFANKYFKSRKCRQCTIHFT